MNAFFKDVALLDQPSVTDNKTPVGKQLAVPGDRQEVRPVRGGGNPAATAPATPTPGGAVTTPYKRSAQAVR